MTKKKKHQYQQYQEEGQKEQQSENIIENHSQGEAIIQNVIYSIEEMTCGFEVIGLFKTADILKDNILSIEIGLKKMRKSFIQQLNNEYKRSQESSRLIVETALAVGQESSRLIVETALAVGQESSRLIVETALAVGQESSIK